MLQQNQNIKTLLQHLRPCTNISHPARRKLVVTSGGFWAQRLVRGSKAFIAFNTSQIQKKHVWNGPSLSCLQERQYGLDPNHIWAKRFRKFLPHGHIRVMFVCRSLLLERASRIFFDWEMFFNTLLSELLMDLTGFTGTYNVLW